MVGSPTLALVLGSPGLPLAMASPAFDVTLIGVESEKVCVLVWKWQIRTLSIFQTREVIAKLHGRSSYSASFPNSSSSPPEH